MAQQIAQVHSNRVVNILGVNAAGQESEDSLMTTGRTLPWLDDNAQSNVWGSWNVTWRDVVMLNSRNEKIAVYNLTEHDLAVPANYDSLKAMLLRYTGQ